MAVGPLSGVRVLDLSRLLPGPFASMVLADLGAHVDKLEEPGGDYLRHMPPLVGDTSAMFLALNRNKRSFVLDLKKPAAKGALLKLLPRYDVLLEQFRPGVMERFGLGHDSLRERFPKLVVCAITGYGQSGPLSSRAGHDINYLARAGLLGLTGPVDRAPPIPGFQLADIGGALWAVIGVLAALAERDRTRQGKIVDIAMTEAALGFAVASVGLLTAGVCPKRGDEALTGGLAGYATYTTKDGRYVSLGALEPKFLFAFARGVGLEVDATAVVPGPHQTELRARIAAIIRSRTRDEWVEFAEDVDCCLEPVLEPDELAGDAHHAARGLFFGLRSPWGEILQMRLPVTAAEREHTAPPKLGEHTHEILREAGLDAEEIAAASQ